MFLSLFGFAQFGIECNDSNKFNSELALFFDSIQKKRIETNQVYDTFRQRKIQK